MGTDSEAICPSSYVQKAFLGKVIRPGGERCLSRKPGMWKVRNDTIKLSSGFHVCGVAGTHVRPYTCIIHRDTRNNKQVTFTFLYSDLPLVTKCEVMSPFTEHAFCLLELDTHWFFFPSYPSREVETRLRFLDEKSVAERNVMEPVLKRRSISAGKALLQCCICFLLLHDKLPPTRGLKTTRTYNVL